MFILLHVHNFSQRPIPDFWTRSVDPVSMLVLYVAPLNKMLPVPMHTNRIVWPIRAKDSLAVEDQQSLILQQQGNLVVISGISEPLICRISIKPQ